MPQQGTAHWISVTNVKTATVIPGETVVKMFWQNDISKHETFFGRNNMSSKHTDVILILDSIIFIPFALFLLKLIYR